MAERPVEFGIYLPQVAFEPERYLERAQRCDELGFDSFWLYDHLYGPGTPDFPSFEAWTAATAVLMRTERLRVGHLVLCNTFRHPVLLAKMAATLDQFSGGRLELGLGSGSYEPEHDEAGIAWATAAERAAWLEESLEIVTRMFAEARVTYEGAHFQVRDFPSAPAPRQSPQPPIHVGGIGERHTLPLVARYADVWNVPTFALHQLDEKVAALDRACEAIGRDPASIRRSVEAVIAVAPDEAQLADVRALAERRFGAPGFGLEAGGFVGTPPQVVDRIGALHEQGFDLFVFFTPDRASDATLELIASEVIPAFR